MTLVGPLFEIKTQTLKNIPIIYIDKGYSFKNHFNPQMPSLSVGDGDSIQEKTTFDIQLEEKKNFTDFHFALSLIPQHIQIIYLTGLMGGQWGHQLANFGEVNSFLDSRRNKTHIYFSPHIRGYSKGQWELNLDGRFNLLLFSPAIITLIGDCEYQLKNPTPFETLSGRGIGNIGHGKIKITADGPFWIIIDD